MKLNQISCPRCGNKMLSRQPHPDALGRYTGKIYCRKCGAVMRVKIKALGNETN